MNLVHVRACERACVRACSVCVCVRACVREYVRARVCFDCVMVVCFIMGYVVFGEMARKKSKFLSSVIQANIRINVN